ncbi:hypothetical protein SAMN04487950_1081 [Halogranum rubrum]|uniref:Uncharacterized protein n=1 Tax=Halogranum rubrum TaxID=553466 RepID=A0A1I4CD89_9EURY|nr:hypothetical protein [Halogranum rubrum]SFK78580.1 hypothetical protein SAMN04487950_1081 [Halogranum rubrum]
MRPRLPSYDHFSVAVGVFVGGLILWALLSISRVVPFVPSTPASLGTVFLAVVLVTWTVLEQSPSRVDDALERGLHLGLGVCSILPLSALLVAQAAGYSPSPTTRWATVCLALAGVIAATAGIHRRATTCLREASVEATLAATQSAWTLLVSSFVLAILSTSVVSLGLEGRLYLGLVIGPAIGSTAGTFVGNRAATLSVTESGLLVNPRRGKLFSVLSWGWLLRVDYTDETLWVTSLLPVPQTYYCDLSGRDDAEAIVKTIRRRHECSHVSTL